MKDPDQSKNRDVSKSDPIKSGWLPPTLLFLGLFLIGGGLVFWKINALQQAAAAAANQPEPVESITAGYAKERCHQRTTTSIGTVMALRSISLRNELAGTVKEAFLTPGRMVETGTLLVALDVSVEEAELKAQEAETTLAETLLSRMERAVESGATSKMELDRARAQLDVAKAQIARMKAIIARKTIRAPFRARIGISDIHPGQYLQAGTLLTTLQGVDDALHVDFNVSQEVAQWLKKGDEVEILAGSKNKVIKGEIVALDAKVDPMTRNIAVRALVQEGENLPSPGASVKVQVRNGPPVTAVSVPVSALRKGPSGDHVFVLSSDPNGQTRASMRSVKLAMVLLDEALISSGLEVGEQVAVQGSFKLRDGALVAVAESGNDLQEDLHVN